MAEIGRETQRFLENVQPIVVANRAPLSLHRADPLTKTPEQLVKGAGGVVTAMASLANTANAYWVCAARDDSDRELLRRADAEGITDVCADDGTRFRVAFVDCGDESYDLHYNVISNPLLWFIQHYLWDLSREPNVDSTIETAWNDGYKYVNFRLADRIAQLAASSSKRSLVLIQDYQLYLVASMVRERVPDALLQHFVHIPWPTPQYWTILPRSIRDAIVHGLLGNDIIGFQTNRDVLNFLLTCEQNLGLGIDFRQGSVFYQGRTIHIRRYPISIDVHRMTKLLRTPKVLREEEDIESWRPRYLILRVDRTDLSKNISRGFLAYERMLEAHPEMHGDVIFWAFLQESRQSIDDYRSYLGNVLGTAARINRRFSHGGWQPIKVEIAENMNRAIAGYKNFDVMLVNPIYDGMNLVAKEGVICNQRNGVLVLSENAGSHEELGEMAITINPFNVDETGDALYLALTMDEHQRQLRLADLRKIVRKNDITRWMENQLRDLRELMPVSATQAAM